MCMNRKPDPKYDRLGQMAVALLTGTKLEEVARREGMTPDELREFMKEIHVVNPPLYQDLKPYLKNAD